MSAGHRVFNCPGCRKPFIWSSRLAGTRMGCACGRRFVMPAEPPPVQEQPTYDVAGESLLEEIPQTKGRGRAGPAKLGYESKVDRSGVTFGDLLRMVQTRDMLIPIVIIAVGIAFRFCLPLFLGSAGRTRAGAGVALVLLGLALSVVTMLAGVGIVAKMSGADLGSMPVTIARLCAISVLDTILFAVVTSLDNSDGSRGMVIAWHAVVIFNWVMFSCFFEFDTQEALFAVAIVGILQAIGACALWQR